MREREVDSQMAEVSSRIFRIPHRLMARRSTLALPKHLAAVGVPPFLSYCGFPSDGGRDDRMLRNPISGPRSSRQRCTRNGCRANFSGLFCACKRSPVYEVISQRGGTSSDIQSRGHTAGHLIEAVRSSLPQLLLVNHRRRVDHFALSN
jgi:hypothetical protein